MSRKKIGTIKISNQVEQMEIENIRQKMFNNFRNVPQTGKLIFYLGKKFKVYPTVFWPHDDSKAIVKNYTVRAGEAVLDMCAGSGVLAIFSALKGAVKVVALDFNPKAIKAIKENARIYKVEKIIDARTSDLFDALKKKEKFDVVTINPPFTRKKAKDLTEATVYASFDLQGKFLKGIKKYLNPKARIYIAQSNFGSIFELLSLAGKCGFLIKKIGKYQRKSDPRIFYAFELRVK